VGLKGVEEGGMWSQVPWGSAELWCPGSMKYKGVVPASSGEGTVKFSRADYDGRDLFVKGNQ